MNYYLLVSGDLGRLEIFSISNDEKIKFELDNYIKFEQEKYNSFQVVNNHMFVKK
jgi:hypothetical protein